MGAWAGVGDCQQRGTGELAGDRKLPQHGHGYEGVYVQQDVFHHTLKTSVFYCLQVSLSNVLKQKLNTTSKTKT